jgi:hypothetical protein
VLGDRSAGLAVPGDLVSVGVGVVDPGAVEPGWVESVVEPVDPGAVDPGAVEPGSVVAVDPGAVDPGAVGPDSVEPVVEPMEPGVVEPVEPGVVEPVEPGGVVDPGSVEPGAPGAVGVVSPGAVDGSVDPGADGAVSIGLLVVVGSRRSVSRSSHAPVAAIAAAMMTDRIFILPPDRGWHRDFGAATKRSSCFVSVLDRLSCVDETGARRGAPCVVGTAARGLGTAILRRSASDQGRSEFPC